MYIHLYKYLSEQVIFYHTVFDFQTVKDCSLQRILQTFHEIVLKKVETFVSSQYFKGKIFREFREFEANMQNLTPAKNIYG